MKYVDFLSGYVADLFPHLREDHPAAVDEDDVQVILHDAAHHFELRFDECESW